MACHANYRGGEPLAYFLTWTTYGSWLPGDERGWVDSHGNVRPPQPARARLAGHALAESVVAFSSAQRVVVERAITSHCERRAWILHACQCREQHVHVVVTAPGVSATLVMTQFKSWATRMLKEKAGPTCSRRRWWTEGGSKRSVFEEADLAAVMEYVLECQ